MTFSEGANEVFLFTEKRGKSRSVSLKDLQSPVGKGSPIQTSKSNVIKVDSEEKIKERKFLFNTETGFGILDKKHHRPCEAGTDKKHQKPFPLLKRKT
jgi:hypothetical protein